MTTYGSRRSGANKDAPFGPLELLRAIHDFWSEGDAALSPYAQLTDSELGIRQLIKQALIEAKVLD